MSMNYATSISPKSMSEYTISDDMRDLILKYMTECNEGRYADSEQTLEQIKVQGQKDHDEQTA